MVTKPEVGQRVMRDGITALVLERTPGRLWQLKVSEEGTGREVWITDAWYHFKLGTLVVVTEPGGK